MSRTAALLVTVSLDQEFIHLAGCREKQNLRIGMDQKPMTKPAGAEKKATEAG